MLQRLTLANERLLAEIVPLVGGGLARLDWLGGARPQPLLRELPEDVEGRPTPGQLACFPLVPWSNRMAPDGFIFEGTRHVPAPNRAGEPCPIHGEGWQQEWSVANQDSKCVRLALDRRGGLPFSYVAQLRYTLEDAALLVELEVRNTGPAALPFGAGLHPWMPDPLGAELCAVAQGVWIAGADKLPLRHERIPDQWNFSRTRPLPRDGVDHAFTGWNGRASLAWPQRGVALQIESDMNHFILYIPPGRDFFCFEPVDHPVNAHNLSGLPGLTVLAPGEVLRRHCLFRGSAL